MLGIASAYPASGKGFPKILTSSWQTATATTQNWTLSGTAVAGELLLFIVLAITDPGAPAGYTRIRQSGTSIDLNAYWKVAAGGETGITTTATGTGGKYGLAMRIANAQSVEGVGTNSADPPSLSPTWGQKKTKWFAAATGRDTGNASDVTVYPTGYTDLQNHGSAALGQVFGGVCSKDAGVATDDPSAFTISPGPSTSTGTFTLAVQPK